MAGPVIAVTDSVFPRLIRPRLRSRGSTPTYRMAKSVNADDIVAVARDADAVLSDLRKAHTRGPHAVHHVARRSAVSVSASTTSTSSPPRKRASAVNYVPRLLHSRSFRPRHGAVAGADPKIPLSNKLVQSGRWEMPAVVPIRRIEGTVLGLRRLRPHPAPGCAQGAGLRHQGHRLAILAQSRRCSRQPASRAWTSTRFSSRPTTCPFTRRCCRRRAA